MMTGAAKLIVSARLTAGTLAQGGKRRVALSMYLKGKAFVGAAILLDRHAESEQSDYVVLHLLCQGIEVILKGLLLFNDYDRYIDKLRRPLGHKLPKIAMEVSNAYGLNAMRAALASEMRTLHDFYSNNLLRYGRVSDIFIDPRTISRTTVFCRLAATIRLAERELRRAQIT
jgi:hypothetical protein